MKRISLIRCWVKSKRLKQILAFSLVELMISLIIVSSVTAAFTPVITKKLKSGAISIGSGSIDLSHTVPGEEECRQKLQAALGKVIQNCMLCTLEPGKEKCLSCWAPCTVTQYKKIDDCSCINCSSAFSKCYSCSKDNCEVCSSGYYLEGSSCKSVSSYTGPECSDGHCYTDPTLNPPVTTPKHCEDGFWCEDGKK